MNAVRDSLIVMLHVIFLFLFLFFWVQFWMGLGFVHVWFLLFSVCLNFYYYYCFPRMS